VKKSFKKPRTFFIFGIIWFLLLYKPIPEFLVKTLEDRYSYEKHTFQKVKGILVLGGATGSEKIASERNDLSLGEGSERLIKAFEYIKYIPNGQVVFTGTVSETELTKKIIHALKIDDTNIHFENLAKNTYQNAKLSKVIIDSLDIQRWGLITSASHMHRAISTFRKNSPEITFEPLPVDFHTGKSLYWYPGSMDGSLQLWQIFIHEVVGLLAYKLTGRL
jgi:uncharacterized SAM-binding protein YcdF (DUF218 family)